ncbi:hypothetical protein KY284_007960 [Solanum tuberosum]|nr:hypothetical protein KY284_007960 [Solanum tuberosum]
MRSLSVKNKLGFINGECKKPALNSPQYRQWERCDNMVTSWILKSLGKEIVDSVEYVSDALELWKELEDRYDQTNGDKLFQIQKEINDLSQGVLDVIVYYTRMKKLWEELNNLSAKDQCSCVCNYGGKENIHKAEQDRRLIQFLMGLNEVYIVIRGHTKERCYKLHGYPQASTTGNGQGNNGYNNQDKYNNNQRPQYNNQFHRSAKGKGIATNAFGIDTESNIENTVESSNSGPNLTKDQYGQLLNLLQHFQMGYAGEAVEDQLVSGAANFAGPFNEEASGNW